MTETPLVSKKLRRQLLKLKRRQNAYPAQYSQQGYHRPGSMNPHKN